jgi:hypothetical protein
MSHCSVETTRGRRSESLLLAGNVGETGDQGFGQALAKIIGVRAIALTVASLVKSEVAGCLL